MTHMSGMNSATDGDFGDEKPSDRPCPKCKQKTVVYRIWESSCGGYEDEEHECKNCRYSWWIEGPDA